MSLRSIFILTLFYSVCIALSDDQVICNVSVNVYKSVLWNGKQVCVSADLERKLEAEARTWHWTPWMKTRTFLEDNILRELECVNGNSIDSFPAGLLNDDQLRVGGFLLYVLFGIYSFTLLAFVCNDYFIPSVETICETLQIPQDVAAATFMSVATSCPEFFVNLISTFLTESDMGLGTIVGSAIFNALGVAALGGLAAIRPIKIDRRAVTRDVLIYMFNVAVLVGFVWDGQIAWYEAIVLGCFYVCYFVLMFNSVRLFKLYDKLIISCCNKESDAFVTSENGKVADGVDNDAFDGSDQKPDISANGLRSDMVNVVDKADEDEDQDPPMSLWKFPSDKTFLRKLWWLYCWPLNFILGMTIPSPVTCKRFYPVTFLMCIVWIGVNSYFITWSMTVIGHTFLIPDSVMGMTFLAFGGCLPEACAIFIMSRRGEGGIGVSNALGANSLAILFALGLPWLIRTLTLLSEGAEVAVVHINSSGIEFIVSSIFVAVACLWITLFLGKFTLRKIVGGVLACLYVIFVTFALLVEMGVILDRAIPLC